MTTAPTLEVRADILRMLEHTESLLLEAKAVFAEATSEQWLWSPNANTWCMALIVEHLNTVSRIGLPTIEEAIEQLRTDGSKSHTVPQYNLLERFFIRLLSPSPPFRVPVPPIYNPKIVADPARETGPEFIQTLKSTRTTIVFANWLDLKKIKIASPADPRIRFPVGVWLEGLVVHNDYHWVQVRALRDHPGFPRK